MDRSLPLVPTIVWPRWGSGGSVRVLRFYGHLLIELALLQKLAERWSWLSPSSGPLRVLSAYGVANW